MWNCSDFSGFSSVKKFERDFQCEARRFVQYIVAFGHSYLTQKTNYNLREVLGSQTDPLPQELYVISE